MNLHPRYAETRKIELEISEFLHSNFLRVGETYCEYFAILSRMLWELSEKKPEATRIVPKKETELRKLLEKLTYGERCQFIGNELARTAKYIIRNERHPNDPDKPGDIE